MTRLLPHTSAPDQAAESMAPATSDKNAEEHVQTSHEKNTLDSLCRRSDWAHSTM